MPPSNAEATDAPVETIETTAQMTMNLSKALHAASFDFRSDTITGLSPTIPSLIIAPTLEMLQSMVSAATFADDIYGRDPTTVLLETRVAKMSGFEGALFTLSGTQGNQICLRTHLTQLPHSILCDERTHVYALEAGGLALLSQAMTTLINPKNGKYITLEEIKPKILHEDVHFAPTRVVSLENTINGVVFPYEEAKRISDYIRSEYKGAIKMHLDGNYTSHRISVNSQGRDCGKDLLRKESLSNNIALSSTLCLSVSVRGYQLRSGLLLSGPPPSSKRRVTSKNVLVVVSEIRVFYPLHVLLLSSKLFRNSKQHISLPRKSQPRQWNSGTSLLCLWIRIWCSLTWRLWE